MPDDVPLEEPPRRVSSARRPKPPARSAGPHAWQSLRGWESLLALGLLLPTWTALSGDAPVSEKVIVAGCLVAILPLYVLLGRPAIVGEDRLRGTIYIVLLIALFTPPGLTASYATFALFGLCPQCFMVFPARRAMIAVIALNLSAMIRYLFLVEGAEPFNFLVVTTIVVVFSATFGVWMERITRQSEERAALIKELESSRATVSKLSAERGAQAERERLAGEIHDTLAQGFTSIIMLIQAAEAQPDPSRHLALAVQTARENLTEARLLVTTLSPAPLDDSTLDEALRRLTNRLGEETGLSTGFEVYGESRPLSAPAEVVLVRATQEGLANVRKHADAESVAVSIAYRDGSVRLEVRDDGRGFEPSGGQGYGLRGMRARVEQVGGTLSVTGLPGEGTILEVVVPTDRPVLTSDDLPGLTDPPDVPGDPRDRAGPSDIPAGRTGRGDGTDRLGRPSQRV
ncbi:sensor histidine kinase [Streptosporangium sp. NBC_01469]|uniref:sensor histidine kinase n=1 Tax=Streptosporangium sp. NBC_01469 TaxID=2903898 RepID=UPI002E2D08CA|nr:sensor histidine kinase [Streptosporangium sp. NBC_01469]